MEGKRLAVLVGCNYPGTENELHGCINDVVLMHETLVQRFRFIPTDIVVLTDAENGIVDQPDYPSGENIKSALSKMIDQAEPGDVLMFHFSGHGMLLEENQHDDGILPSDGNIITDHDFRGLVDRLPKGASLTILSDSCHSGGLIDKEKEQIGDDVTDNSSEAQVTDNSGEDQVIENPGGDQATCNGSSHHRRRHHKHHRKHNKHHKIRGIDHGSVMKQLRSKSGLDSDNISDHLVHLYGDEASPVFRDESVLENKIQLHPDNGILLSGCQHYKYSRDMPGSGDDPHGAFTYAILSALKEHEDPISNEELVRRARSIILINEKVEDQHPCLYSSDSNKDAPFLFEGLK